MSLAIDVSAKVEILRRQFVQRMLDDASVLQSFVDRCGAPTVADAEIQALRKICHSLCGAAGVFGYSIVANAASRMSAAFASGERDGAPLAALARALIEKIHAAANS
jgi:HPt (histidine-containing phosphotransfer) domain-containing protein